MQIGAEKGYFKFVILFITNNKFYVLEPSNIEINAVEKILYYFGVYSRGRGRR